MVAAVYPAAWGVGQLVTGLVADYFFKKDLLFIGMLMQGSALLACVFAQQVSHFIWLSILLGIGTALVYPTLLATVAENANLADRAGSLGVFRFWRDLGYAISVILPA